MKSMNKMRLTKDGEIDKEVVSCEGMGVLVFLAGTYRGCLLYGGGDACLYVVLKAGVGLLVCLRV